MDGRFAPRMVRGLRSGSTRSLLQMMGVRSSRLGESEIPASFKSFDLANLEGCAPAQPRIDLLGFIW
jgi:hypothetical protein